MTHQRRAIALSAEEVEDFLRVPGRVMALATLNPDGTPHLAAMWYGFLPDGSIVLTTYRRSQKARNLARDSRFTALVESGTRYEELCGVQLKGTAELRSGIEDVRAALAVIRPRYPVDPDRDPRADKRLAIVLRIDRVVSWHHAKIGRSND